VLKSSSLLAVNLATLGTAGAAVFDPRLPCRGTRHEHFLDILESLARRLGEEEESVDCHGGAEDAEDEVDAPLDVDESGWDEVGEGEVEDPEMMLVLCVSWA
jgi:hypothetical protein